MSSDPITAPCRLDYYPAAHDSGTRSQREIKWVVLHSSEGSTAEGAARWFRNPASAGSAHLSVDDDHCYRSLSDETIPWAAPGANTGGIHIEQAGFAAWGSLGWLRHRRTLNRAAYKTATRCKKYGIPVRFVTAAGLRGGASGITTHRECTAAFGGTHSDPGAFWPRRFFMRRVRRHYSRLT